MKIANIACAWPPYAGGMAGSARQISDQLRLRHEVVDFTPVHNRPLLRYGHAAVLPQLLWRLRRFDYIYLHYPFFGTVEIVWLFKLLFPRGPKLIIHYHMDATRLPLFLLPLSLPSRWAARKLFRQAETIVTASLDYVRHGELGDIYRRCPGKFREIPFGLDLKHFQPRLLNRPAANRLVAKAQEMVNFVNDRFIRRRLRLLFVGGLDRAHYFKGVPILLQSLAHIGPGEWHLDIVGDGELRPELAAQAGRLNLASSVSFRGRLSDKDLLKAYQEADIFILPSINGHEAFGIVLTEALACGVPVIASDLPGVRSVFSNYQEGLLAAPGDVNDLSAKLRLLMEDEPRRRQMALAARRLSEERYDINKMTDALFSLFV